MTVDNEFEALVDRCARAIEQFEQDTTELDGRARLLATFLYATDPTSAEAPLSEQHLAVQVASASDDVRTQTELLRSAPFVPTDMTRGADDHVTPDATTARERPAAYGDAAITAAALSRLSREASPSTWASEQQRGLERTRQRLVQIESTLQQRSVDRLVRRMIGTRRDDLRAELQRLEHLEQEVATGRRDLDDSDPQSDEALRIENALAVNVKAWERDLKSIGSRAGTVIARDLSGDERAELLRHVPGSDGTRDTDGAERPGSGSPGESMERYEQAVVAAVRSALAANAPDLRSRLDALRIEIRVIRRELVNRRVTRQQRSAASLLKDLSDHWALVGGLVTASLTVVGLVYAGSYYSRRGIPILSYVTLSDLGTIGFAYGWPAIAAGLAILSVMYLLLRRISVASTSDDLGGLRLRFRGLVVTPWGACTMSVVVALLVTYLSGRSGVHEWFTGGLPEVTVVVKDGSLPPFDLTVLGTTSEFLLATSREGDTPMVLPKSEVQLVTAGPYTRTTPKPPPAEKIERKTYVIKTCAHRHASSKARKEKTQDVTYVQPMEDAWDTFLRTKVGCAPAKGFPMPIASQRFDPREWKLSDETKDALSSTVRARLGRAAGSEPLRVYVLGFADERGAPTANLIWAERRANEVRDAIKTALGDAGAPQPQTRAFGEMFVPAGCDDPADDACRRSAWVVVCEETDPTLRLTRAPGPSTPPAWWDSTEVQSWK